MGKRFMRIKTLASIGIWTICLAGYPFCMTYAFDYPFMLPLMVGLCFLLFLLIVKNYNGQSLKIDKPFIQLYIILFFFWIFQMVLRGDLSYISNIFQVLCIVTIYFAITNLVMVKSIARQYVYFMIANCIGGSIIMALLLIHNFPPLFQYLHHNGLSMASFYYLTFTNVAYDLGNYTVIRYSGLFDESGAVAFYSMFALLINKVYLKNKRIELLLIFLPMATFSLAHFVTVVFYSILFYIKRVSSLLLIVLFLGSTYILLEYSKGTEYSYIYKITLGRMQTDDSGRIKGDNRTELNENSLFFFKESPVLGKGKTFFEDKTHPIGGIFFYGALYGIVGYIFIYIIFYYTITLCLFRNRKLAIWMDGFKCCLVIMLNLFQRPDMTNIFQLFSITLFALCIWQLARDTKTARIIIKHERKESPVYYNNGLLQ
jgi:hypothetical protein